MTFFAVSLSGLFSGGSVAQKDIFSVGDKTEMGRIAAKAIIADVMKNGDMFTLSGGDRSNHPSVNKPVGSVPNFVNSDTTVAVDSSTSPVPTTSNRINFNLSEQASDSCRRDFHNTIITDRGTHAN